MCRAACSSSSHVGVPCSQQSPTRPVRGPLALGVAMHRRTLIKKNTHQSLCTFISLTPSHFFWEFMSQILEDVTMAYAWPALLAGDGRPKGPSAGREAELAEAQPQISPGCGEDAACGSRGEQPGRRQVLRASSVLPPFRKCAALTYSYVRWIF